MRYKDEMLRIFWEEINQIYFKKINQRDLNRLEYIIYSILSDKDYSGYQKYPDPESFFAYEYGIPYLSVIHKNLGDPTLEALFFNILHKRYVLSVLCYLPMLKKDKFIEKKKNLWKKRPDALHQKPKASPESQKTQLEKELNHLGQSLDQAWDWDDNSQITQEVNRVTKSIGDMNIDNKRRIKQLKECLHNKSNELSFKENTEEYLMNLRKYTDDLAGFDYDSCNLNTTNNCIYNMHHTDANPDGMLLEDFHGETMFNAENFDPERLERNPSKIPDSGTKSNVSGSHNKQPAKSGNKKKLCSKEKSAPKTKDAGKNSPEDPESTSKTLPRHGSGEKDEKAESTVVDIPNFFETSYSLYIQEQYFRQTIYTMEEKQIAESVKFIADARVSRTKKYFIELVFEDCITQKSALISEELFDKLNVHRENKLLCYTNINWSVTHGNTKLKGDDAKGLGSAISTKNNSTQKKKGGAKRGGSTEKNLTVESPKDAGPGTLNLEPIGPANLPAHPNGNHVVVGTGQEVVLTKENLLKMPLARKRKIKEDFSDLSMCHHCKKVAAKNLFVPCTFKSRSTSKKKSTPGKSTKKILHSF